MQVFKDASIRQQRKFKDSKLENREKFKNSPPYKKNVMSYSRIKRDKTFDTTI